jgi:hypothetical protein
VHHIVKRVPMTAEEWAKKRGAEIVKPAAMPPGKLN